MSTTALAERPANERAIGILLVFVATVGWSFSGVFTRLLTTDIWTAIAWRSFFGGLFLAVPYVLFMRPKAGWRRVSIGRPGVILILSQVACQAATVGGLYYTTVANVTVIYATRPSWPPRSPGG